MDPLLPHRQPIGQSPIRRTANPIGATPEPRQRQLLPNPVSQYQQYQFMQYQRALWSPSIPVNNIRPVQHPRQFFSETQKRGNSAELVESTLVKNQSYLTLIAPTPNKRARMETPTSSARNSGQLPLDVGSRPPILYDERAALQKVSNDSRFENRFHFSPPAPSHTPTFADAATATENQNHESQEHSYSMASKMKSLEMEIEEFKKQAGDLKAKESKLNRVAKQLEEDRRTYEDTLDALGKKLEEEIDKNAKLEAAAANGGSPVVSDEKIAELERKMEKCHSEMETLRREGDDQKQRYDRVARENEELRKDNEAFQKCKTHIDRRAQSVFKIEKENCALKSKVTSLEEQLAESRRQKETLEGEAAADHQRVIDLSTQCDNLEKEMEQMKKDNVHRDKYSKNKNDLLACQKKFDATTKELETVKKELEETKRREQAASEGNTALSSKWKADRAERDSFKQDNDDLKSKVIQLQEERNIVREQLTGLPLRLRSIKDGWIRLKKDAEEISSSIKAGLASVETSVAAAVSSMLKKSEEDVAALQLTISSQKTQIDDMICSNERHQGVLDRQTKDLKATEFNLHKEKGLSTLKDQQLVSLQNAFEQLQKSVDERDITQRNANKIFQKLKDDVDRQKAQINSLTADHLDNVKKLTSEAEELKKEIEAKNDELEANAAKIAKLEAASASHSSNGMVESWSEKLRQSDAQGLQHKTAYKKAVAEMDGLKKSLQAKADELLMNLAGTKKLEEELKSTTDRLKQLEANRGGERGANVENDKLKATLARCEAQCTQYKNDLDDAFRQNEAMMVDRNDAQSRLLAFQKSNVGQLDKMTQQFELIKYEKNAAETRANALQDAIANTVSGVMEANNEIEICSQDLDEQVRGRLKQICTDLVNKFSVALHAQANRTI